MSARRAGSIFAAGGAVHYDRNRYIYNDLTRRAVAVIFTASHAGGLSFESPKIQNGFFTREFVDVLTSAQTDANKTAIGLDECRPTCR